MEIPGIASFGGQPALTNPLSQDDRLAGQQTQSLSESETQNTVSAQEQDDTSITTVEVVNQAEQTDASGFNSNNPGGTIDFTV